jgi:hypothetical protein
MKKYEVTGKIVCWHCRRSDVTLKAFPEPKGPTLDYYCSDCEIYGKPPIGNVSQIPLINPKKDLTKLTVEGGGSSNLAQNEQ